MYDSENEIISFSLIFKNIGANITDKCPRKEMTFLAYSGLLLFAVIMTLSCESSCVAKINKIFKFYISIFIYVSLYKVIKKQ